MIGNKPYIYGVFEMDFGDYWKKTLLYMANMKWLLDNSGKPICISFALPQTASHP